MSITKNEVLHIAALSRLSLSEEEIEKTQSEMGAILNYITKLSEVDTGSILPRTHVNADVPAFRNDETVPFANPEGVLNNAPQREGAFFVVPKIL